MDERGQFTFYSSIFASACRIRNKAARADFYDAICNYALNGVEPDLDRLSDAGAVGFISARPNLDASRKKAKSGKAGGSAKQTASKPQANGKHPGSEKEREKENEKEVEIEVEIEGEEEKEKEQTASAPFSGKLFTVFWDAYPRKIDSNGAWEAWKAISPDQVTAQKIIDALADWKKSGSWEDEGGRYVPEAAKFLGKEYWKSPAPAPANGKKIPVGGGPLGETELENIQRLLKEADDEDGDI